MSQIFWKNVYLTIFGWKWPKMPQKLSFLSFSKKFVFGFPQKWSRMKDHIAIIFSASSITKFWFLSYSPECCHPIKLQNSLNCNISRKSWEMVLIFCRQSGVHRSLKITMSFSAGAIIYVQACPKYSKITNCYYFWKKLSDWLDFLHWVRYWWKLLIDYVIFAGL